MNVCSRILLCVSLLAPAAALADFNEGVAYYARGEYDKAAQVLIPLAESANQPMAQYFLGAMYAKGQGVEQSYEQAAKWYRSAAEKGVAPAQYKLGLLYRDGHGVPHDMEYAYAWLSVATKLGHQLAPAALSATEGQMAAAELDAAKKLSEDYIQKYAIKQEEKPAGVDEPLQGPPPAPQPQ